MEMPGRTTGTTDRYGFNGKEKDRDINSFTAYDYGFRIYNPGIGKFFSLDPLTQKYPELTPYQFASNNPILNIDIDGLEGTSSTTLLYHNTSYSSAAGILKNGFNAQNFSESGWNWLMTNPKGVATGSEVAQSPVQLSLKLNISTAKTIEYDQWHKWYSDALKKLGYKGGQNIPDEVNKQAIAIRNQTAAEYMTNDGGKLYRIVARRGGNSSGQIIVAARDEILADAEIQVTRGSAARIAAYSLKNAITSVSFWKNLGKSAMKSVFEGVLLYSFQAALEAQHEANMKYAETHSFDEIGSPGVLYYTNFFKWWKNFHFTPENKQVEWKEYNKKYGTNYTEAQFNTLKQMGASGN